jgi:cell wall-associated NlpC family hydrolase
MKRIIVVGGLTLIGAMVGLVATVAGMVASLLGTPPAGAGVAGATASIPAAMLRLYGAAAATCPGLPWQVLAGVGTVESDNGASSAPGVHSGANPAGAEGPMQFEPATFAAYDRPVPPGGADPPSPYDPADAVYAAARMLCANGGLDGTDIPGAIFAYNHDPAYVARVLAEASRFGMDGATGTGAAGAGAQALAYALSQVGTPYRWGAEESGVGFDCSGLTQAAYAAAGVGIPRVAAAQFAAGPLVPPGEGLSPGDLVFFGPLPGVVTHVGLVVDPSGVMVDAPHTGASVRIEAFNPVPGAPWGGDLYLGATDP